MSDRESRRAHCLRVLLLASLLAASASVATAADPAPSGPMKDPPVRLEPVAGSTIKRVVLTARAAERIGVKSGTIEERSIIPMQMVGGIVVEPSAAGAKSVPQPDSPKSVPQPDSPKSVPQPANSVPQPGSRGAGVATTANAASRLWVRVSVSPAEWGRMSKDKPVRVLPLETRQGAPASLVAVPTDFSGQESTKSGMLSVFYAIAGDATGLAPATRVRVEVPLQVATDMRKTVPYSAVLYDAKGDAWVYVQTGPYAYLRERITLDRVVGEYALLSAGPPTGTPVATIAVALLYGSEVFGK